jgi:hypothetical protein
MAKAAPKPRIKRGKKVSNDYFDSKGIDRDDLLQVDEVRRIESEAIIELEEGVVQKPDGKIYWQYRQPHLIGKVPNVLQEAQDRAKQNAFAHKHEISLQATRKKQHVVLGDKIARQMAVDFPGRRQYTEPIEADDKYAELLGLMIPQPEHEGDFSPEYDNDFVIEEEHEHEEPDVDEAERAEYEVAEENAFEDFYDRKGFRMEDPSELLRGFGGRSREKASDY